MTLDEATEYYKQAPSEACEYVRTCAAGFVDMASTTNHDADPRVTARVAFRRACALASFFWRVPS
jgi:hypothetical protein